MCILYARSIMSTSVAMSIFSIAGAQWHDPHALAMIRANGGVDEIFLLPLAVIVPGTCCALVGALAAGVASRVRIHSLIHRGVDGAQRRWDEWRGRDHWWLGRAVELLGDRFTVEGCTFSLRSPIIGTAAKSRMLIADYERGERAAIARHLDPSLPVIELGGCLGVVATLTNRRLRHPDRHVVVEAHPDLLTLLRHNRDRNAARFDIVSAAVAYGCDAVEFGESGNFLAGRIAKQSGRRFTVPAVTLSGLIERYGFDRCTVICDIEGAEADLIQQDSAALAEHVDTFIVEWHPYTTGADRVAQLQREVEAAGFSRIDATGAVSTYKRTR